MWYPCGADRPLTESPDEHVRRVSASTICSAAAAGDEEARTAMEGLSRSSDEHIRITVAATLMQGCRVSGGVVYSRRPFLGI